MCKTLFLIYWTIIYTENEHQQRELFGIIVEYNLVLNEHNKWIIIMNTEKESKSHTLN